jgi:hypothetical protein
VRIQKLIMMDVKLIPSNIIESLSRSGAQEYDELLKNMQKLHDDLSTEQFMEILMEMEIQGLVRVLKLARGKRRIELA